MASQLILQYCGNPRERLVLLSCFLLVSARNVPLSYRPLGLPVKQSWAGSESHEAKCVCWLWLGILGMPFLESLLSLGEPMSLDKKLSQQLCIQFLWRSGARHIFEQLSVINNKLFCKTSVVNCKSLPYILILLLTETSELHNARCCSTSFTIQLPLK